MNLADVCTKPLAGPLYHSLLKDYMFGRLKYIDKDKEVVPPFMPAIVAAGLCVMRTVAHNAPMCPTTFITDRFRFSRCSEMLAIHLLLDDCV
jgi:hypothetical protein